MTTTPTNLTSTPQRGTITYRVGNYAYDSTMSGHFHVTDQGVIARRDGGRKTWLLCSPDAVIDFQPKAGGHGVAVGDIFVSTWGYDQTNVDFYQVVRVTKASVEVRKVAQRVDKRPHFTSEMVVPVKGQFIGEPHLHRIRDYGGSYGQCFTINTYSSAHKWNGEPVYQTAAGYGH